MRDFIIMAAYVGAIVALGVSGTFLGGVIGLVLVLGPLVLAKASPKPRR